MRVYGRKLVEKREKLPKRQKEKAALISYSEKEMSGVNGDRCGRKVRNIHRREVWLALRLGSQKRGCVGVRRCVLEAF